MDGDASSKSKNDIRNVCASAYNEIYDENSFTPDVIIKIGPAKTEYYTHRMVLATGSEFLRLVLAETNPGTLPVILLPDVNETCIDYVFYYLYHGEVQVPAEIFQEFIETCELLELKRDQPALDLTVDLNEYKITPEVSDEVRIQPEIVWLTQSQTKDESVTESMDVELEELENLPDLENTQRKSVQKTDRRKSTEKKQKREKDLKETDWNKKKAQESLNRNVKKAYESLNIPITNDIDAKINNSRLFIQNKKILRGIHNCGLCDRQIRLVFTVYKNTGTISFNNINLRCHINKIHHFELNSNLKEEGRKKGKGSKRGKSRNVSQPIPTSIQTRRKSYYI